MKMHKLAVGCEQGFMFLHLFLWVDFSEIVQVNYWPVSRNIFRKVKVYICVPSEFHQHNWHQKIPENINTTLSRCVHQQNDLITTGEMWLPF